MKKLLIAEQIAEVLQVPVSWVHERTRKSCPAEKQIPHIRLPGGRYVRFDEEAVLAWMQNGCRQSAQASPARAS